MSRRPRLAVFKFASCDGCQLQLLNLERELLLLAERIEIAHFPEATSRSLPGPYDLALVEGSISTPEDAERIREVRESARRLVTIGACATAGGIQWLRALEPLESFAAAVYPRPEWLRVMPESTPVSEHVPVDYELHGCPVSREQLLRVILRELLGTTPDLPQHSVCIECKRRGAVCVTVAAGTPCLGPATRAGCGAICPALGRGCYGCFGAASDARAVTLARSFLARGESPESVWRRFSGITGREPAFRRAAEAARG